MAQITAAFGESTSPPDVILVLAIYDAFRNTRRTLSWLRGTRLSVDQTFVLAQIGLAADRSVEATDHIIRELLQKRASTVRALFFRELLTGGRVVGERFQLSDKGREEYKNAVDLITSEVSYALRHGSDPKA